MNPQPWRAVEKQAVISRLIESFIPQAVRDDPAESRISSSTVAASMVAWPFLFAMAIEQYFTYGLWTASLPIGIAGTVFAATPLLLRVLSPPRVRDVLGATIYLAAFAIGIARGGLLLSIITWNLVLVFGAGLFSSKPVAAVWGALILFQAVALYLWRAAEVVPYVPALPLQELLGVSLLFIWTVVAARLMTQARDEGEAERRALTAQVGRLERIEALGRLSGGVAHDFNNLLMVISGHAGLLRDEIDDAELLDDLDAILEASSRGREFTGRLLAMSRGESAAPTLMDVSLIVKDFGKLARRVVPQYIEFELDFAADATAMVDPAALEQVLLNACMNSADALPQGGTIRLEASVVAVTKPIKGLHGVVGPGRWVKVTISDTGTGIPPAVLEHMFDAFYSTKSKTEGTGIGLSTAFSAIRELRGEIIVESQVGIGTKFEIFLPFVAGEAGLGDESSALIVDASDASKLLLVDDEPGVRSVLRRVFEKNGYEVVEAADGDAARRIFEANPDVFDLVVTDVIMPHFSGVELASAVRAIRPKTPFVFVSGYVDGEDRMQIESDNSSFVQKPFSQKAILKAVRAAMEQAEAR